MNEHTAIKHDSEKCRLELIPAEAMLALGEVLTYGARKYNDRNWELGMNWGRVYGALMRHLWSWWAGKGPTRLNFLTGEIDHETGLSHLWHALACLAFLVTYELRGTGTDDRYSDEGEQ